MRAVALLASAAAIGTTLGAALASQPQTRPDDDDDNPLPLIIWHGLGDSASSDGLAEVAELAAAAAPGIFVHTINPTDDGTGDDRSASLLGNVTEQVQTVCDQLARHPILSTAPAVDAIGFSQGGQFLRGYVERCNRPPVRNLITFGSQHAGITRFRDCAPSDLLCRAAMGLLRFNVWGSFVQGRVVPAQYYRPAADGDEYASYLAHSNYLADINNERAGKNPRYRDNLARLDNFVMYLFGNDTVSIPKESSWFGEVDADGRRVALRDRAMYKEDWLGLRALDDKGRLKFRTVRGDHMQIPVEVLNDTMREFLGPFRSKVLSVEVEDLGTEEL
ncbi:hypothetical protein E4U42_000530 [Claviceps africana]|uniref:Palmitoyl-protein thioesterase 1 n=1 Tax=Claviceps africana TaxID=83212 RepID=A0A8K0J2F3_9HYPO|nr:hypothetical protein E4U42_000530 [Claviceps africana]